MGARLASSSADMWNADFFIIFLRNFQDLPRLFKAVPVRRHTRLGGTRADTPVPLAVSAPR